MSSISISPISASNGLGDTTPDNETHHARFPLPIPPPEGEGVNESLREFHVKPRCVWAGNDSLYQTYHDREWGMPLHDDQRLFEFLVLEGAQAGLSWITILRKRENYRAAFDNFDATRIARYGADKIELLRQDAGIVRNRLKIESTVTNAQKFLDVQDEFGSFAKFVWQFVGGTPKQNAWRSPADVPASTPESDMMSKELKRRGFKFVGTTICYAHMQATGMVNDHTTNCFRHAELSDKIKQPKKE